MFHSYRGNIIHHQKWTPFWAEDMVGIFDEVIRQISRLPLSDIVKKEGPTKCLVRDLVPFANSKRGRNEK